MGLWGFQNPDRRVLATWSLSPMGQETPLCRALGAEQPGAQGPGGQPGALGRRVAWGGPGREPVGGGVAREPGPGRNTGFPGPSGHRGHFVQFCPGRWVRARLLKEGPPPCPPHRLDLPEPPLGASPAASRVLGGEAGKAYAGSAGCGSLSPRGSVLPSWRAWRWPVCPAAQLPGCSREVPLRLAAAVSAPVRTKCLWAGW